MTTPSQWFYRTCGSWTSERRYLFAPKFKPVNMTTEFTISDTGRGGVYQVDWTGQTQGQMILTLDASQKLLERSRDYFDKGQDGHTSRVTVIDADTICLHTEYDGTRFREEIRLIESDMFRLRQTVGYNLNNGQLVLAGQYFESRT